MMLPPRPDSYMRGRQALVVRKAPSRWMASIFFHSLNGKSSRGCTICTPALLTRMSITPNSATAAATPLFTAPSSVTSMAIASARGPARPISSAVLSACALSTSAMTTWAPSAANLAAISLPMPLAAPVTMAVFPSSLIGALLVSRSYSDRHRWHALRHDELGLGVCHHVADANAGCGLLQHGAGIREGDDGELGDEQIDPARGRERQGASPQDLGFAFRAMLHGDDDAFGAGHEVHG